MRSLVCVFWWENPYSGTKTPKLNINLDWSKMDQFDPNKKHLIYFSSSFQLRCHHQLGFFNYWIIGDCYEKLIAIN